MDLVNRFFNRHSWNALPPRKVEPLDTPVANLVSLWAESDSCSTIAECQQVMRDLQKRHLDQGMSDIRSNFYAGGDGNIYEGRGWYSMSPRYSEDVRFADELNGKCIEIAYLGRQGDPENTKLAQAANNVLNFGVAGKYLANRVSAYFDTYNKMEFLDSFVTDPNSSYLPGGSQETTASIDSTTEGNPASQEKIN